MIEIKVKAEILNEEGSEAGISISHTTEGTARELLHESLAVVRAVAGTLRKSDPFLLVMFLEALRSDHSILLGVDEEDEDEDKNTDEDAKSFLAELMSKAIIGKGEN